MRAPYLPIPRSASTASQPPPAAGVLRLVPLGGLGEIGMNCLAVEEADGLIIIDCGVTFPNNDLGIDVYHPRFDYLFAAPDRVRGVVITHGHEDHIGALPYLLRRLKVPIFGPPHALALVRERLAEQGFAKDAVEIHEVRVGQRFQVGPFAIEPIRVTHSIADATALAIETAAGTVVHTGDFKFDPTPADGELTDELRLMELGERGVRLLLSDSTNVDSPGSAESERTVGDALDEITSRAKGRVVVGMFASNVQRLLLLGGVAQRAGRRICLLGRSVMGHAKAAQTVGRLSWPSDLVVPPDVAAAMPRERVLIIASGTQAERMSALTRLAAGTHQTLRLDPGDTVILSSRVIPGNDRAVSELTSDLLRLGVDLHSRITDRRVHASGHAHREEQRRMIELTRPRAFLPVHGTLHHLLRHAELAREAGVSDVAIAENGEVVELTATGALARTSRVVTGRVATAFGETLGEEVLRERGLLGRMGIVVVSVTLDARGQAVGAPRVTSRGVFEALPGGVERKVGLAVVRALGECDPRSRADDETASHVVRTAARRAVETHSGRRPVIVVSLTRGA